MCECRRVWHAESRGFIVLLVGGVDGGCLVGVWHHRLVAVHCFGRWEEQPIERDVVIFLRLMTKLLENVPKTALVRKNQRNEPDESFGRVRILTFAVRCLPRRHPFDVVPSRRDWTDCRLLLTNNLWPSE